MKSIETLRAIPVLVALLVTPTFAAEMSPSNVPIISGGIGFDDQQFVAAREREYNLKLLFTLNEGNYISDVDVVIQDAGGRTLAQHETSGPFMLAKLPSGSYNVVATYEGKRQTRRVNVGAGLRTEQFRWPSNPSTDFPAQKDIVDPPRDVTAGRF